MSSILSPLVRSLGVGLFSILIGLAANAAMAQQMDAFQSGTLIPRFGKVAPVEEAAPIPPDIELMVRFDVSRAGRPGGLNQSLLSGARFLNMHAGSGVEADRMHLAFVIHGSAVHDVTNDEHYSTVHEGANANAALIRALQQYDVKIYVCGQSAAFQGVESEDLLPGVEMALSAMTAHVLLHRQGYSLNPF